MADTPSEASPARMSTRNQARVNYTEMVSGSGDNNPTEPVFRSPTASTRGRRKRVAHESGDLANNFLGATPKRGRPRGALGGTRGNRMATMRRATTEESTTSEVEERELVAAVKSGKRIPEAVDRWIDRYNETYVTAVTEMHQFFFAICGCKGTVTQNMSTTMSYKDIICRMTEDFEEESADYPLVHGGSLRKVRANLHIFIHTLISRIKASLLFDSNLMDGFVQLLTGMADSQVRAFRHTATFCAMKITSALVDVTIELTQSKEKTTKQIEAEKMKMKNSSTGNEKYEALVAQRTQTEERAEEIRQIIGYMFRSVFVHRYRDVVPDIRCICIVELGHWMDVYPEHFVDDSYLKYIGWSLFDKVGDVRHRCVHALIPLFEKTSVLDKLELFVNKFKERLVSMLLDKDLDTSVETVHLMRALYSVFPTLLAVKDVVPIYELVYATSRPLAIAAGAFLNTKVFMTAERPGKTPNATNLPLVKDLATFMAEGDLHQHATYLVDALIETNPIVKDWATMGELLLNDQYQKDVDSVLEAKLIEIMMCSVQQTTTGDPPVGRHIVKKGPPSAKETRDHIEDRNRLTEILMPLMPRLLTKFGSDLEKVINLVMIPLNFQLDMYLSARMQPHLLELMDCLDELVERHVDEELLKTIAELYYLLTNHVSISALVDGHKMKLLDGIAAFIKKSMQLFEDQKMDEEEEARFASYMKRMAAFAGFMDLKHWNLWDTLMKITSNYNKEDTMRDVKERAMQMLFLQLCFDLISLKKEGDSTNPKVDHVRKLKKRRDQLIRYMTGVINDEASGVEQAYLALCDMMIVFGRQLGEESKTLEPLIYSPEPDTLLNMKCFLSVNVFSVDNLEDMEQQQRIETMHKMRQHVAQYAKLIIHGAIRISDAADILRHYQTHFADFGDIFKNLLSKCREIDFVETGVMILETLKGAYIDLPKDQQTNPISDGFNGIRELAKRLGQAFGSDYAKNRFAVASLHKKAIDFAFEQFDKESDGEPKNIYFLEIASEYSSKLLAQDKLAVTRYLNKMFTNRVGTSGSPGEPYRLYLKSLSDRNDDDNVSVRSGMTTTSMRSTTSSTRGRGRGRRQRVMDDF